MKNLLITAILIFAFNNIIAQYDFSGMPVNQTIEMHNSNNAKDTYIITPSRIINVIPSPIEYIADITFDGNNILAEGYNEYQIYKLDTATGNIINTIPTDIKRPYGLCFDGNNIWILDNDNKEIKQVNPIDGSVIKTISINSSQDSYPTGLTYMNKELWYNDAIGANASLSGDLTHNIDTLGQEIQIFPSIGGYPSGLTYDGTYLWSSDNVEQLIHQIDPVSFEVIHTIEAPGGIFPNGLAWDGQYLWVANNDADSIYQICIDFNTNYETQETNTGLEFNVFPNPVTDYVNINFNIKSDSYTELAIYNSKGQLVNFIACNLLKKGEHHYRWDGKDSQGIQVSNNIYYCRMICDNKVYTKKLVLLR